MTPACSIVIRAFNEEKHLGRLLAGILHQNIKDVQIILVDSGSSDGTLKIASEFPVEVVRIQPEEFSFGHSLNLGINQATADWVIIASAHVYPVYDDWLERLLEPLQSDPQVALVYGKQRGAETTQFSEKQLFLHWYAEKSTHRQSNPFCNNANAAIRRTLWEKHPYNETLPALEDLSWARWVFEQGLAIAYSAEAEVIHVHQESWRGITNRYRREAMAFKQIYPQEHFHFIDLLRTWSSNVLSDCRAARNQNILGKVWWDIIRFRWMQSRGTYLGYHQSGPLTWRLKQTFYYPREHLHTEKISHSAKRIDYSEVDGQHRD